MKKQLLETLNLNKKLISLGLQIHSFGNASIRYKNFCIIKPSGANLKKLKYSEISVVDIHNKKKISGKKPSVDLDTHLEIYRNFPNINSIIHTHSIYATSWAQAKKSIPCYGTTHADYYFKEIPITKSLNLKQVEKNYELQTGKLIVLKIKKLKLDPLNIPGILASSHGPFAWGSNSKNALSNAQTIEYIAKLAFNTEAINFNIKSIPKYLQDKHYKRKIGPNSYYGQSNNKKRKKI